MSLTNLVLKIDTSKAEEIAGQVQPWQWGVLALVLVVLVFALVKKLVKTAVFFGIIAGIVALGIYGNSQGWFT